VPQTGQTGGLSDELQPYVDAAEVETFDRMGEFLRSQRPTPPDDLLTRVAAGLEGQAPPQLRLQVAASLLLGLALLGLALLGASGSGPFGG
jgi:type VI protein secretion system component VasF